MTADYVCTQRTLIAECLVYDNNGDCEKCSSTHYLYEDNASVTSCVLLNFKPGEANANTENCKTYHFNTSVKCKECSDNYYLETNNAGNVICVPYNNFYIFYNGNNVVTNQLKMQYKTTTGIFGNCNQFDYDNNRCIQCKTGTYFWGINCCT